jgi:hypothetical protein
LRIPQFFLQERKIGAAILIGRIGFPPIDATKCDVAGHTEHTHRLLVAYARRVVAAAWGRLEIIAQFRLTSFQAIIDEFSGYSS